jgi:hypothetical protein
VELFRQPPSHHGHGVKKINNNMKISLMPAFASLALAATALAQPTSINGPVSSIGSIYVIGPTGTTTTINGFDVNPTGTTTLVMGNALDGAVLSPIPGPSHVRVPAHEEVRLLAPESFSSTQWLKDGKPIAGATSRSLVLPSVTSSDAGVYSLLGGPTPFVATGINLDVAAVGNVGVFSTRVDLAAGAATVNTAFVVTGRNAKNLLIRAVGPTLKNFGIANPVARPRIRFFDSTGKEISFVHPAVVNMDAFFKSLGAFPLVAGGSDAFEYAAFPPGTYTILVSDDNGQGGTVLVEAYEYSDGPTAGS